MRTRNWLLLLGLPASMAWSVVVNFSMPSWFDPGEDCALTLGRASSAGATVRESWFPPRATCDFGDGQVYDFVSPARTVVLTVTGVLIALVLAVGLVLWVKSLFQQDEAPHSQDSVDLRQRRFAHLTSALVLGALGTGALLCLVVVGLVFGGPPGILTAVLGGAVGLAAAAGALDRSVGPLPSTAAQSRRRGAFATAILLVCTAIGIVPRFPVPQFGILVLAAALFAVTVLIQWSRAGNQDNTFANTD
ncbi:hypothetical protein [Kribbella lupini]|uniref:SdpI/YhfL family protein n=1 Tax=Kribbella lupini TaxID=291602 RepID=A0ABN2BXP4_9ACTN